MWHIAILILIETLKLFRIFFKCLENEALILLCNDIHHHITDNNIKIVDMRKNRTDSGCVSMVTLIKVHNYLVLVVNE